MIIEILSQLFCAVGGPLEGLQDQREPQCLWELPASGTQRCLAAGVAGWALGEDGDPAEVLLVRKDICYQEGAAASEQ